MITYFKWQDRDRWIGSDTFASDLHLGSFNFSLIVRTDMKRSDLICHPHFKEVRLRARTLVTAKRQAMPLILAYIRCLLYTSDAADEAYDV